MKKLVGTYRTWIETLETFYIESYDEEDFNFYCIAPYYEDSWHFEQDYVLNFSRKASILDIIKYKLEKLLYKI